MRWLSRPWKLFFEVGEGARGDFFAGALFFAFVDELSLGDALSPVAVGVFAGVGVLGDEGIAVEHMTNG